MCACVVKMMSSKSKKKNEMNFDLKYGNDWDVKEDLVTKDKT